MDKLCKDCRYYIIPSCHAPENMVDNLVSGGKRSDYTPQFLRETESKCGVVAKWFEPKVAA